jgi:hypothetical protein
MENWPIQRPSTSLSISPWEKQLSTISYKPANSPQIQEWYHRIEEALRVEYEQIWANIGQGILVCIRLRSR